jgi:hypothetical protein
MAIHPLQQVLFILAGMSGAGHPIGRGPHGDRTRSASLSTRLRYRCRAERDCGHQE